MARNPKKNTSKAEALSKGFAFLENLDAGLNGTDTVSTFKDEPVSESCESEFPNTEHPEDYSVSKEAAEDLVSALSKSVTSVKSSKVTESVKHFKAFGRSSPVYKVEAGETCPHCRFAQLEEVISFSGKVCEFFVYCPNCNAYICTYKPMPHQEAFHRDEHMQKLYAGGFGSAKTYTCGMEFLATVLQIPNSAGLIGAKTWGQVADTCLKFVTDNLPEKLVANSHQDKVSWYIDLVNGSRISAKAFDKEGKIRSANLSIIWIEEASEVDYEIFAYLLARVRNKVGFFKGKNRLKVLLSSNPDVGWLNTNFLMKSSEIHYHGEVKDRYNVPKENRDPAKVTHISATSANSYLPPDYEVNLARDKEDWWVNRYLKGSFKYTEGLVYPSHQDWFITPFAIPKHWRRITGTDFGRRDPTAHLVAALDPIAKVIYVYNEIEEPLDDKVLDYMVDKIRKAHDFPESLLAFPHQCDPRGRNRDQVSGQSWIDAYREKGIVFVPAKDCEASSIAPTIQKVANYAQNGRLKIFDTCRKLKESLSKYKYPERKVGDDKNQGENPVDKHNHLPDALRYMLAPFPQFPEAPEDFGEIWTRTMASMSKPYNPLASDDWMPSDYVSSFMDNFG